MRVAIDGRWMQPGRQGGVGRALANVVPRLRGQVDVALLTDAALPPADLGVAEHPLATPWPGRASLWLQWSAPRWLRRFDGVFHCPFYGLPWWQPVPTVVTIHDLTFEHHRAWFGPGVGAAFRVQARHAARTAAAVLTPSEHVRSDVMATYGVAADRVLVAPNAVDPIFAPTGDDAARDATAARPPYVVALGGAPRRNVSVAVEAWRAATSGDIPLVVVGGGASPQAGVRVTGHLPDAEWAALLRGAAAFVYPTLYEGFGMPALEAIASGTPTVCGRVGALPEVLGDAAAWADDTSAEAVAHALGRVLTDERHARDLRDRGLVRAAAAPTWDDAAAAHLAAYRQAARVARD